MFFLLTADVQCDFGSYQFTRGGDKRGKHHETKWRKKLHTGGRERWWEKRVKRGKSSKRGNRFQEAGAREGQWWRWMESDSLEEPNQWEWGEVTETLCHSDKTWLPVKAKRTVTKSGEASEPRAVVIKHLHQTVRDTREPPGKEVQGWAVGWTWQDIFGYHTNSAKLRKSWLDQALAA